MFRLIVSLPASAWITSRLAASAARARIPPNAKGTVAAARQNSLLVLIVRLRACESGRKRADRTGRDAECRQVQADCHRGLALSQLRSGITDFSAKALRGSSDRVG